MDENFKSTFSRSLRNLEDKGLVDLDKGYRRIVVIKITEKGEGALNATCKLRIREEVQAMERRVDRSLGRTQEKPGDSAGGLTGAKL